MSTANAFSSMYNKRKGKKRGGRAMFSMIMALIITTTIALVITAEVGVEAK
jgi:hypothetical protein